MEQPERQKRLGELLVERGLIDRRQLITALKAQQTSGGMLGAILIKMGFVSDEDLSKMLAQKKGGGDVRKKKLGEILMEEGLIDEHQLKTALTEQKQWGGKLGAMLVRLGFVSEEDLARILSIKLHVKWVSLRELLIPDSALSAVSAEIAKKYFVMPLQVDAKNIAVATSDPTDLKMMDTLGFIIGKKVRPVIAVASDIKWAIARYYDKVELKDEGLRPKSVAHQAHAAVSSETPEHLLMQVDGKRIRTGLAVEGLLELLVQKGVMTKEEFFMMLYRLDPDA